MSSSIFRVQEHKIPGSHIREYPRALADDQEDVVHLSVKQYTPLDRPGKDDSSITVVGAHANGFPKVSMLAKLSPLGLVLTSQ